MLKTSLINASDERIEERSDRVSAETNESKLPERPDNKVSLMPLIERYWNELNAAVSALNEEELLEPGPDGGWSVKDHLAHLTVWERVLLARIAMQPEHDIFHMDEATYATAELNTVNARIYEHERNVPLSEVLAAFKQTHQQVFTTLERMSDDELARPVFPDDPEFGILLGNVAGDTYEHYLEHLTWIRAARENR